MLLSDAFSKWSKNKRQKFEVKLSSSNPCAPGYLLVSKRGFDMVREKVEGGIKGVCERCVVQSSTKE